MQIKREGGYITIHFRGLRGLWRAQKPKFLLFDPKIQNGSKWLKLISKWLKLISNSKWLKLISNSSQKFKMAQNGSNSSQNGSNSSQTQNGSNSSQTHLKNSKWLHPLVKSIQERVQGLSAHAWYLDDGTFVGKEEELEQVLDILVREGPARGLVLSTTITSPNNPKTTVWSKEVETRPAALLAKGAVLIEDQGINLLGAPIGSREFVEEEVRKKVEKVRVVTELLPLLQDPHVEFVLLRSCLSMPKFSFVLRTTDTTDIVHLLRDFDAITRDAAYAVR